MWVWVCVKNKCVVPSPVLPCGEKKGLRFSNARITLSGMRKIKRKKKKDKKLEENGTIEREEKNETTLLSHCNDGF